jgi:ABC-type sugar transport system ATPase subunit
MGRALVRRPRLFLFDEPLSNLDASLRAQMRVELKRLHAQLGITTVYVTHDQVEAMTLADRIALMHEGVIQQYGPPRLLYNWPANRFVAGFLGSPPMNFATVTWDGSHLVGEGLRVPLDTRSLVAPLAAGTSVQMGIRPHDLSLCDEAAAAVRGTLYALEPMGWETIAHVQVATLRFTARIESAAAADRRPGDPIFFAVDPSLVRLFGASDGLALQRPPEDA